jgi:hypothetical protein
MFARLIAALLESVPAAREYARLCASIASPSDYR